MWRVIIERKILSDCVKYMKSREALWQDVSLIQLYHFKMDMYIDVVAMQPYTDKKCIELVKLENVIDIVNYTTGRTGVTISDAVVSVLVEMLEAFLEERWSECIDACTDSTDTEDLDSDSDSDSD